MGHLWDLVEQYRDKQPYPPSNRQITARLGLSPGALSSWRNPKDPPRAQNLLAFATLANIPYEMVVEAALRDTGYKPARDRDNSGDDDGERPVNDRSIG